MELTEELFVMLAEEICGSLRIPCGEHEINLERPWRRLSLSEGVAQHAGVDESECWHTRDGICTRLPDRLDLKIDP